MRMSENQLDHQVQACVIMVLHSCFLQVLYVGTLTVSFKGITNILFLLTLTPDFPFLSFLLPVYSMQQWPIGSTFTNSWRLTKNVAVPEHNRDCASFSASAWNHKQCFFFSILFFFRSMIFSCILIINCKTIYSPYVDIIQNAPRNVYKKLGSFWTYKLKRLIQLFFQT